MLANYPPDRILGQPFVTERFTLTRNTKEVLREMKPKFGYSGFGEAVFYRTYSRNFDGYQETWCDVVIRCIEGTMSLRKDWYKKTHVYWDETYWQRYAFGMAVSMFEFQWTPPGRGMWAMGTDFIYERGSLSLYNCCYTDIGDNFDSDFMWLADCLMNGCGVGFGPIRNDDMKLYTPCGTYDWEIADSREGWVYALGLRIQSYLKPGQRKPRFIYDKIRGPNEPIKGFGGLSSGPEPLRQLLDEDLVSCLENYKSSKRYDSVRLKADIGNQIGCCVVAGNVRRSAEMMCGLIDDQTFIDLKVYEKYPERARYGWMSNNAVILESDRDFESLGEVAVRVVRRGEPGVINKRNMPLGRIGKKEYQKPDNAVGFNPCGEIGLESGEVCNVAETYPTVCESESEWYGACEYSTCYCSTVSLLPTHHERTNRVVARNRRIGVSIVDVTGWRVAVGAHKVTQYLREGYKVVCESNRKHNGEAGVPEALRKTTIKPGGTAPKLPGKTPGQSFPNFDFTIRRMRCQAGSPFDKVVSAAGYPRELDIFSANTAIFEFPIKQGPAKPISQVTLWEQAMMLTWMQREWADNAVSNTLYFRPKWARIKELKPTDGNFVGQLSCYTDLEISCIGLAKDLLRETRGYYENESYRLIFNHENKVLKSIEIFEFDPNHEENDVEPVLSFIAPLIKSVALCPHSECGHYPQMPEQGCTQEEYEERLASVSPIDWSKFGGSDGLDERFCEGPTCEVRSK